MPSIHPPIETCNDRKPMIDILFFGRMAGIVRERALRLELTDARKSLFGLREEIFKEFVESGRVTLKLVQMSVNQAVTRTDQPLTDGDEIAFFSVFSGG